MHRSIPIALAVIALVAGGCGHDHDEEGGHDHGGGASAKPCEGFGSQTAGAYSVLVALEEAEPIMSEAEAKASTEEHAHVAIAGSANNDPAANLHLEVMICDAASGAPAAGLTPEVLLRDATDGGDATPVPMVEMREVEDAADHVHYGNNVVFESGHQAEVTVRLAGGEAVFKAIAE